MSRESNGKLWLLILIFVLIAVPQGASAEGSGHGPDDAVARLIVQNMKLRKGLALDIGCGDAGLAMALARVTNLKVRCLDPDEKRVASVRKAVDAAGLYGSRITAEAGPLSPLMYPDNCAVLVFCGEGLAQGKGGRDFKELYRVLSPNGIAFIGQRAGAAGTGKPLSRGQLEGWLKESGIKTFTIIEKDGVWARIAKPFAPGWDEWTHRAHDPGNSFGSRDSLPFGSYRPRWIANFKPGVGTAATAVSGGRLIFASLSYPKYPKTTPYIQVLDAFSGVELWSRVGKKALPIERPIGTYGNRESNSDFFVVDDELYLLGVQCCHVFDLTTGKEKRKLPIPAEANPEPEDAWLYLARVGETLFGGTGRKMRVRDGWYVRHRGVFKAIFAMDLKSGTLKWISNKAAIGCSVAVGDGRLYYCSKVVGEDSSDPAIHHLHALDTETGKVAWNNEAPGLPPGCAIAQGAFYGDKVWVLYNDTRDKDGNRLKGKNGKVIPMTAFVNDPHHDRELVAFGARDGKRLFKAEFGAHVSGITFSGKTVIGTGQHSRGAGIVDIETGKALWKSPQQGHKCSPSLATANTLVVRHSTTAVYDLAALTKPEKKRAGRSYLPFKGFRPTCSYPAVPGYNMLFVPAPGCGCSYPLRGNVAMVPGKPSAPDKTDRFLKGPAFGKEISSRTGKPIWSSWRADPARSGRTAESAPASVKQVWTRALPGKLTPTAVGYGSVILGSSTCKLVSLDAATGKQRWQYFTAGPVRVAPFLWEGRVYASDEGGWVHCLRADSGALIWRFRAALNREQFVGYEELISRWPAGSGVMIHAKNGSGTAYFAAGLLPGESTAVYALDARTGEVQMEEIFKPSKYGHPPVPRGAMALGEEEVFFVTGVGYPWKIKLGAAKPKAGNVKGYHTKGSEIMVVDNRILSVTPGLEFLYHGRYDAGHSGHRLPIVSNDTIVSLNQWISAKDRKASGSFLAALKRDSQSICTNRNAYFRLKKELRKAKPETYRLWKAWKNERMTDVIEAGGTILSGGKDKVFATSLKDGRELWEAPVSGVVEDLAFQAGTLVVLTGEGRITCFGKRD